MKNFKLQKLNVSIHQLKGNYQKVFFFFSFFQGEHRMFRGASIFTVRWSRLILFGVQFYVYV